jgi:hypothetical protein
MAETILSQVIRESAESTQRLLAASSELERQDLFGLMELSAGNVRGLQSDWEAVKERMVAGVESMRLQTAVERVLRAAEAEGRLASMLLEMAERDRSPTSQSAVKIEAFRLAIGQVESIRLSASRLLDWLRAPRDPLNEKLLEQSILDFERGNYESGDDLLGRLQAGGDL